jgi:hypothetical protein
MDGNKLDRLVGLGVAELAGRQAQLEAQKERPSKGVALAIRMTKAAIERATEIDRTGAAKGHSDKPFMQHKVDKYSALSHGSQIESFKDVFHFFVHRPDASQNAVIKVECSDSAARREFQGKIFSDLDAAKRACERYLARTASGETQRPSNDPEITGTYLDKASLRMERLRIASELLKNFKPVPLSEHRQAERFAQGQGTYPEQFWI